VLELGGRIVSVAVMQDGAKDKAERLVFFDCHRTGVSLMHGRTAKGIGHEDAVVAVVPPGCAEVGGCRHQGDADTAAILSAGIVTPGSCLMGPIVGENGGEPEKGFGAE
jgi:hypothetical protein